MKMNTHTTKNRGIVLWFAAAGLVLMACGCPRPGKVRAEIDQDLCQPVTSAGVTFRVEDGMAVFRRVEPGILELWESVPVIRIFAQAAAGSTLDWSITISNCMPGAQMSAQTSGGTPLLVSLAATPIPTRKQWNITLLDGDDAVITVGPPDRDVQDAFHFAWLSDIQEAIDHLPEFIAHMNADSDLRFVLSGGDLCVERRSRRNRLLLIQQMLESLDIPFYSVPGNHDIEGTNEPWRDLFGRNNIFFRFKGVHYVGIDSASATIDPVVYKWLDDRLLPAADPGMCVYFMHIPPFDPEGDRQVGFTTRKEAAKLISLLVEYDVDICFYGHIHTYVAYSNGGIPAYLSGGGGAEPVGIDGIGRHYLKIEIDTSQIYSVGLVRME
jgi:Icc-related predicted phosphoesterase